MVRAVIFFVYFVEKLYNVKALVMLKSIWRLHSYVRIRQGQA